MNALFQHGLFQNPWSQALAWTLLHFLWEGLALGLVAWVGLRLLRSRSANARYLWGCVCLGLMLAAAAFTFTALRPSPLAMVAALDPQSFHRVMTEAPWPRRAQLAIAPFLPWALAVWSCGVAALALRLGGAWLWLQRLRFTNVEPLGAEFQMRLNALIRDLRVHRAVGFFKSALVEAPVVIGWLRPAILVPAAAITGLTPEALDAVLAHELAHIRRHDYLVNLAQSALEIVFFYHPAVWWLSGQIRLERENACDDVAVASCGDALFYARSLTRLEELRGSEANPNLALASNGGSLMHRIHRLLLPPLQPSNAARAGLIAVLAFSLLGATTYRIAQDPAPKTNASKPSKTTKVVVRSGGETQDVAIDGDVNLDPDSKEMVRLGPGGSIELKVREGGQVKKFMARKDPKGEVREWTVDGKVAPMTAADEAWLKEHLKELKRLETSAPRTPGRHANKIIIKKHGDAETVDIEGLEGLADQKELDALAGLEEQSLHAEEARQRHEETRKIIIEAKRMAKDAKAQAKEAEQQAKAAARQAKNIRVIVRKSEVPHQDDVTDEDLRQAEIEALRAELEHMMARLDRLQKRGAPIKPLRPLAPMPPGPPKPPTPPPPPPAAPEPPVPPTPPDPPATKGSN